MFCLAWRFVPYLFTRGKRYLSPHRLVEAFLPVLRELVELLDAIAVLTGDERWLDAWEKLRNARDALLERSDAERRLLERAREVARVDEMLCELERHPEVVERIRSRPRKPMARVIVLVPKLLAAKLRRR